MADKKKITREAMLNGLEALELEVKKVAKKTDAELEEIIEEHLKDQELAFECGECGKDIPDLKTCPYCAANYDDDDADDKGDSKSGDDDDDKGDEDDKGDDSKGGDDDDDDSKDGDDDDDDKPAKKDDKKSGGKAKDDKKQADKKPAPAKKADDAAPGLFEDAVKQIQVIVKGKGLDMQEKKIYFAWYKDGAKVFAINKNRKVLQAFFHPDKLNENKTAKKVKGFEAITPEQAKERHYGSVRAIYEGNSVDDLVNLVKELVK